MKKFRNKKRIILLCLCLALCMIVGFLLLYKVKLFYRNAPADDQANHGVLAIMETEKGYYYNYGFSSSISGTNYRGEDMAVKQLLRYFDKDTRKTTLLCNKPECDHQGSKSCVATYKNIRIINSLIYNGKIYIYGLEENKNTISFNLYRASLNGSSIKKVGTVLKVENTLQEGIATRTEHHLPFDETFIIHKGYAYLPYYLRIGKSSKGFMGGGVVQMDLLTGKTKTIYEMKSLNSTYYPYNLKACGDYVYMDFTGYPNGTKRYVISEDRLEYPPALQEWDITPLFVAVTEDRLYSLSHTYNEENPYGGAPIIVNVYDSISGIPLYEEDFETDLSYNTSEAPLCAFPYDGMLVLADKNHVAFYDLTGLTPGTKLGEIDITFHQDSSLNVLPQYVLKPADIKICNDKLYLICNPTLYQDYSDDIQKSHLLYQVYSCPVKDILKGEGRLQKAFEFKMN